MKVKTRRDIILGKLKELDEIHVTPGSPAETYLIRRRRELQAEQKQLRQRAAA